MWAAWRSGQPPISGDWSVLFLIRRVLPCLADTALISVFSCVSAAWMLLWKSQVCSGNYNVLTS